MIQFTSIVKRGDGSWVFSWLDTGAPSYRIIFRGNFVREVNIPKYTHTNPWGRSYPPPIEVVESGQVAVSEEHEPYFTAQWYRVPPASYYQFSERDEDRWVRRQRIAESNAPVYTVRTPRLEDESVHEYRVRAADALDQFSEAVEYDTLIVTPPDFPETDVEVNWDKPTTSLVITEA